MKQLLKNKKGWVTRDFVIAGILFSGIVALVILALGGLEHEYPGTSLTSEDFSSNYDKLVETTDDVEIMRNESTSGEGLDFVGSLDVVFKSTFTTIQLVFATLGLYGGMGGNIISDFPFLSSSVLQVFFIVGISIVTVVLVFVWLSSITRGNKI